MNKKQEQILFERVQELEAEADEAVERASSFCGGREQLRALLMKELDLLRWKITWAVEDIAEVLDGEEVQS